MKKTLLRLVVSLSFFLPSCFAQASAVENEGEDTCKVYDIEVEHLPDLNIPRSGHHTLWLNGELTVVGGHTSGFVPTPTIEYLKDGKWHVVKMVYEHDHALCVPLHTGRVLIAGGHEQALGIGHTFTVELYDPVTHTCEGYGCLEQKRFFPNGAELADGRVIISGNSYHADCIECFDGSRQNKFLKEVSQCRALPLVFPVAADDAIIFGGEDSLMEYNLGTITVDRVKGDSFRVPLFDEWVPLPMLLPYSWKASFIGDEATGRYAYLFAVKHKKSGQVAIAHTEGLDIQLLPTVTPVPMEGRWGPIAWEGAVVVDRQSRRGYLMGHDKDFRILVLRVDYDRMPAPLSLYYVDKTEGAPYYSVELTPEGNLVLAGGVLDNNFTPFSSVLLFPVGSHISTARQAEGLWLWIAVLVMVLVMVALFVYRRRQHRSLPEETAQEADAGGQEASTESQPAEFDDALMKRIVELMEDRQLFLNNELKVADVSEMLEISSRSVSDCIKAGRGCSFAQFVNGYRIAHAQRLLKADPDMKIAVLALHSGFANETSFFRTFKTYVGMTPREWIGKQAEE